LEVVSSEEFAPRVTTRTYGKATTSEDLSGNQLDLLSAPLIITEEHLIE
jgi:hypothetical protein